VPDHDAQPDPTDARIELVSADITTLEVDAIVNAANQQLTPGGGVCGAIHRAAGPELAQACAEIEPVRDDDVRCPTGEARITDGFELPARKVIHAVGPVWQGGSQREANKLAAAYRNSLESAHRHGLESVAFSALSCGVFGYPIEEACAIALGEIRGFLRGHEAPARVVLCCFDKAVYAEYARLLARE